MPSLRLRRFEESSLDPIPFPTWARGESRGKRVQPALDAAEDLAPFEGDSIAMAEAALRRLERGVRTLAFLAGTDPDRPRAA